VQMYEGEDRARRDRMGAAAARLEGGSALRAGSAYESAANTQVAGTIFEGAYGLFGKYGRPNQRTPEAGTPSGLGPYR